MLFWTEISAPIRIATVTPAPASRRRGEIPPPETADTPVARVNRFMLRAEFVAKKKKPGRAPAVLTKRFVMRCTPGEFVRWARYAKDLGMSGVAPLVRKATNDALAAAAA